MALDLEKLNEEQRKAVQHKDGPLLIVAGAGTGKTTVITDRIVYLIENSLAKPEEILAVTFTEKASSEMQERVDIALDYGYTDIWISTFHSFAERVLRENAIDIGLPDFKLMDDTSGWLLMRQNIDKFDLKYYKPLGNPSRFIASMLNHFGKCKDQMIYPKNYLEYADKLKTSLTDLPEESEEGRVIEVANAYHTYQQLLLENNYLDFGDLINYCLKLFSKRPSILKKYQNKFKYILVDEFQDTNKAQYELIKLLATPHNNLTVTADDDQCLPGDALISTIAGEKKIKTIKAGDTVLTAVGRGHIGVSKVSKIFKTKKPVRLLTIKTKSGACLEVSDNHKMFCFVPQHYKSKYCYVYLMYRQDVGWRMGTTKNIVTRIRLERSSDKIIAVKAFKTEKEARYYETLWSLKYGIPTSCFQERKRILIKNDLLFKLYRELQAEKNVALFARDFNIDLTSHHFALAAVDRGKKLRLKINLNMCCRNCRSKDHVRRKKILLLNSLIRHSLTLETSDKTTINKLKQAGYQLRRAKKGMLLRLESQELQELGVLAKKLEKLVGGIIELKCNLAIYHSFTGKDRTRSTSALLMPAKNLVLGHYLPIRRGSEVIYDEIIEIKEREKKIIIYDLEICKTHNFFANNIAVHNSIYKWRGASVSNIKQFKKDFPKAGLVCLVKNYRSGQEILDTAYNFIQANNPNRLEYIAKIDKKLKSQVKEKSFVKYLDFISLDEEAKGVALTIKSILKKDTTSRFSDFAILVRANDSAVPFTRALEREGLPYQFLASRGLYQKPVVLDAISYLKMLDNYHESLALYRVLNLPFLGISSDDIMLITQESHKKAQSVYETLLGASLLKGIGEKSLNKIVFLLSLIQKHTKDSLIKTASEVLVAFLNDSGYLEYLVKNDKQTEIDLLVQFYEKIKAFENSAIDASLKNFLDELNWQIEGGDEGKLDFNASSGPDEVKVMTIHSAKGLEFRYVFLVSLVDRRFPSIERKDPIEIPEELANEEILEGDVHLEEERRLFYVALTRAKKGLFLTTAKNYGGKQMKKPSLFLQELGFVDKKVSGKKAEKIGEGKSENFKEPEAMKLNSKVEKWQLPSHFSFTQIAAFNKCPYQYKLAHILKVPIKGKASFSFGKTIHNTLDDFLRGYFQKKSQDKNQSNLFGFTPPDIKLQGQPLQQLLEIYEKNWLDEWYENKKQKEEYKKLGKEILKDFYQDFVKNPPKILEINGQLALEINFHIKVGDYMLRGKIDRIDQMDGGVKLIDYKTGKKKEKLQKDDKIQLLLYQMAAEEFWGLKPVELSYYYLEDNSQISFLGTEKEKQGLKESILETIDKIKQSNFKATPGFNCQFCDFRSICQFASGED